MRPHEVRSVDHVDYLDALSPVTEIVRLSNGWADSNTLQTGCCPGIDMSVFSTAAPANEALQSSVATASISEPFFMGRTFRG